MMIDSKQCNDSKQCKRAEVPELKRTNPFSLGTYSKIPADNLKQANVFSKAFLKIAPF